MPLIGIIDPAHKQRANTPVGQYPRWVSLQEALDTGFAANPKWSPWPYELIATLLGQHQERGSRLSVTTIVGGCMRGTLVERREDYIGSLDSMFPALRGTLIHSALERGQRAGSLAEWRFYTDINGQEISGSPDLITYDTLWDYKTTENPPSFDYMYTDHKLQLQFNRFIFNHATHWEAPEGQDTTNIPLDPHHTRIQHLAIVYIGPKGPKVLETVQSVDHTTSTGAVTRVKVPDVWSDDRVLAEMTPRMEGWKLAWDNYPDWPDGLEKYPGWEGPPSWQCPGAPLCYLPNCTAKRYPHGLVWDNPEGR